MNHNIVQYTHTKGNWKLAIVVQAINPSTWEEDACAKKENKSTGKRMQRIKIAVENLPVENKSRMVAIPLEEETEESEAQDQGRRSLSLLDTAKVKNVH